MTGHRGSIRARTPWPHGDSDSQPPGEPALAPRHQVVYHCAGHDTPVTLATGATPPPTWDCHCGRTATLDGSPAQPRQARHYRTPDENETDHQRCVRYVLNRRTLVELEQLLAERLDEIRASR